MQTKTITFLAIALTMLFGVGFAVIPDSVRHTYAVIGGVLIAILWMANGYFGHGPGRNDRERV